MRDLSRAREAAVKDLTAKRQQISSLLLRHGLFYPGKKTWGRKHRTWLAQLKLAHHGTRLAFEELMAAEREDEARVGRLEAAIREAVPEWSLVALVVALQASWRSHAAHGRAASSSSPPWWCWPSSAICRALRARAS